MMYYDPDYKITRDPAVVKFMGKYYLYYTTIDGEKHMIGIATSEDLTNWVKVGEIHPTEEYEGKGICAPFAGVDKKGNLFILYQTNYFSLNENIACAFSRDGINFVKPEDINPIYTAKNEWSLPRAIDADLIEVEGKRFLYFATRLKDRAEEQVIGLALANDEEPFSFIALDRPVLRGEYAWEKNFVEAPSTCFKKGKFIMFYGGGTNPQYVGLAISDNGLDWKKLSSDPFIKPERIVRVGDLLWEQTDATHPFFFSDNTGDYIFFHSDYDHKGEWPRASAITFCEIEWDEFVPRIKK